MRPAQAASALLLILGLSACCPGVSVVAAAAPITPEAAGRLASQFLEEQQVNTNDLCTSVNCYSSASVTLQPAFWQLALPQPVRCCLAKRSTSIQLMNSKRCGAGCVPRDRGHAPGALSLTRISKCLPENGGRCGGDLRPAGVTLLRRRHLRCRRGLRHVSAGLHTGGKPCIRTGVPVCRQASAGLEAATGKALQAAVAHMSCYCRSARCGLGARTAALRNRGHAAAAIVASKRGPAPPPQQITFCNFPGCSIFPPSRSTKLAALVQADGVTPCKRVGIMYSVWHWPAYRATQLIQAAGGTPVTVRFFATDCLPFLFTSLLFTAGFLPSCLSFFLSFF